MLIIFSSIHSTLNMCPYHPIQPHPKSATTQSSGHTSKMPLVHWTAAISIVRLLCVSKQSTETAKALCLKTVYSAVPLISNLSMHLLVGRDQQWMPPLGRCVNNWPDHPRWEVLPCRCRIFSVSLAPCSIPWCAVSSCRIVPCKHQVISIFSFWSIPNNYDRPANKYKLFNLQHASAHNIIKQIFGVLKGWFWILLIAPEYSLDIQARILTALCVIHNFVSDL
jgi:hypothetical protein